MVWEIRKLGGRHLTFFFQLVLISSIVTLSSCLIWQIISFILSSNEYDCVYDWTTLGNIATDQLTEDADFGKNNHIFIYWKADAPKTSHCWCRSIIGQFFFENDQGKAVTVNGDRYRLKRRILATFGFNRTGLRATQPKLHSLFCDLFLKIPLSATELMSFGQLGAAIDTVGLLLLVFVGCRQR